tara:strand:- start:1901 stop:2227 length:327 start_codon:yes stop_codon:yes gene_type:complete
MTRILFAVAFLAGFVLICALSSIATGQTPPSRCAEHAVIKNAIINRHGEVLQHQGVSASGKFMVEVYLDSRVGGNNAFTVTITEAKTSITCIVFSGYGWTGYTLQEGS